jgi:hypothetical protein
MGLEFRGYDRDDLASLREVLDDAVKILDESTKDLLWWTGQDLHGWPATLSRYGVENVSRALAVVHDGGDGRRGVPAIREGLVDLWSTVDTVIGVIDRLTEENSRLAYLQGPGIDRNLGPAVDKVLGDHGLLKLDELNRMLATGRLDAPGLAGWLKQHLPDLDEQAAAIMTLARARTLLRTRPDALREAGMLNLDGLLFGPAGLLAAPTKGWTPFHNLHAASMADWTRAVGPGALNTGPHPDLAGAHQSGYFGGGFITGPDGRRYPLVVPSVFENGKAYTGDSDGRRSEGGQVEDLDGGDPGWTPLCRTSGFDMFGPATNAADRINAFLAGTAEIVPFTSPLLSKDQDYGLWLSESGYPSLGVMPGEKKAAGDAPPGSPPGQGLPNKQYGFMPLGDGRWGWVDMDLYDPSPRLQRQYPQAFDAPPERDVSKGLVKGGEAATTVGDALGVVASGLRGASMLGKPNLRFYRVEFQQNRDGRVRAILRTYRIFQNNDNDQVYLVAEANWFDEHGELAGTPIRWRDRREKAPGPSVEVRRPYPVMTPDGLRP